MTTTKPKTMTLLEKAKSRTRTQGRPAKYKITPQHGQLIAAYLNNEVTLADVSFALFDKNRKTGTMVYSAIVQITRALHASGELTIKLNGK